MNISRRRVILIGLSVLPGLSFLKAEAFWPGVVARLFIGAVARQVPRTAARLITRSVGRRLVSRSGSLLRTRKIKLGRLVRNAYDVYSTGSNIALAVKYLNDNSSLSSGPENTTSVVLVNEGDRPFNAERVTLTMEDIRNDEYFKVIFDPVDIETNSALILQTDFPIGIVPGEKEFELDYSGGRASNIYRRIVVGETLFINSLDQIGESVQRGKAGKIFDSIPE